MARTKSAVGIGVGLLVAALILAIVGFVVDVLRWLLIIAAVLVLASAVATWLSRRSGDSSASP